MCVSVLSGQILMGEWTCVEGAKGIAAGVGGMPSPVLAAASLDSHFPDFSEHGLRTVSLGADVCETRGARVKREIPAFVQVYC